MARERQEIIAWRNMLPQHHPKPKTEAVLKSMFAGTPEAAKALDDLRRSLDMDAATGARLDLIGSIVGQTRAVPEGIAITYFGYAGKPNAAGYGQARYYRVGDPLLTSYSAADPEYRRMIKAKIALNNSHGTAPEIAQAMREVYNAPASVRTVGGGVGEVWIGTIPLPTDALAINPARFIPAASAVRFGVVFFRAGATFGYAGKPNAVGYGKGPYARTPRSNIKRIV